MTAEVPLHTLSPGSKFLLHLETTGNRRPGTLLHIGSGSCLVEWAPREHHILAHDRETGESKEVVINRTRRENVSLNTLVEPEQSVCETCEQIKREGGFGPSHNGSKRCESGSIASGGQNAHCTCDTCF